MRFDEWSNASGIAATRYFSLARHALVAALAAESIGSGDAVLLPEFICRDVLAALNSVGARAVWYPVTDNLVPATPPGDWPAARAVLAVNYFGFPPDLKPFQAYAARTNALLIEDNAHGFLSRDETGAWLGTRADYGIFSFRKTLPIPDGAALVTAEPTRAARLPAQLLAIGPGYQPAVATKARIRRMPLVGIAAVNALTAAARFKRRLQTGRTIPESTLESEQKIPCSPAPHAAMAAALAGLDVGAEIERRRKLYRQAEAMAAATGIMPLFPTLPPATTPYGFPFRTRAESEHLAAADWARTRGLDCILWPDLPEAAANAPAHTHAPIHLVNFL